MKQFFSFILLALSFVLTAQQASREPIPYEKVDVKPEFKDGKDAFLKYIQSHYRLPDQVISDGRITVSFVIQPDGSLTDFGVVEHLGQQSGEKLIQAVKKAGNWTPGRQDGKPVAVSHTFSVNVLGP